MMSRQSHPRTVLVYEAVAFAAILAIVWIDEIFEIPEALLRPYTRHPELWEGLLETVAIVAIAATILRMTRRVLSRLFYLESFLKVCAWCRKIQREDRWVTIEEYLASGFATRTTHGMCPECASGVGENEPK